MTKNLQGTKKRVLRLLVTVAFVLAIGLLFDGFSSVCYASQGKVTATSAKIRKEASSSSETIGSAANGKEITIKNQVQGSDGYMWYLTFVDANTTGYIRSDLVTITDGTTPQTVTAVEPTVGTGSVSDSNSSTGVSNADVSAVNPVSANVSGGSSVRVRDKASTKGGIVTTVDSGLALTVTGTADGSDGKVWYQVNFSQNGKEIIGFIRSDFVKLSGELTPFTETPVTEPSSDTDSEQPEKEPEVLVKDYDTQYMDDEWFLIDNVEQKRQSIKGLFDAVSKNAEAYEKEAKKVRSQKIVIIILVLLLVAAIAALGYFIFRMRDMVDDAYFKQVERDTLGRRNGNSNSVRRAPAAGQRSNGSSGQKPAPNQRVNGPASQRPAGGQGMNKAPGQRPAGGQGMNNAPGQRPAVGQGMNNAPGQRPAGSQGMNNAPGQRPAGGQGMNKAPGQRPAGGQGMNKAPSQRPAGGQGMNEAPSQRPAGGQGMNKAPSQRPAGGQGMYGAPGPKSEGMQEKKTVAPVPQQDWQSKNFMTDEDDDFQFNFLNGDDEDNRE